MEEIMQTTPKLTKIKFIVHHTFIDGYTARCYFKKFGKLEKLSIAADRTAYITFKSFEFQLIDVNAKVR